MDKEQEIAVKDHAERARRLKHSCIRSVLKNRVCCVLTGMASIVFNNVCIINVMPESDPPSRHQGTGVVFR